MMTDDDPWDPQPDPMEQEAIADAASVKEQRKRTRIAKKQSNEARAFWAGVFGSEVGRREMWRLLQACHTFEERFACGPNGFPQTEATWFHAGEQAIGQRLYQTWINRAPEAVILMHQENDPRFTASRKGG